jgi:hypothetical protein
MKNTQWIWLVGALILVGWVLWSRERFQPEFLDYSQVNRTLSKENASYDQSTNHMHPQSAAMGPVLGMPTPFQVNQYKAHVL